MRNIRPMTKEQLEEMKGVPQGYKDAIEQSIDSCINPGTHDEHLMANYYRGWQIDTEIGCGISEENMKIAVDDGYDQEVVWFVSGWQSHQHFYQNVGDGND